MADKTIGQLPEINAVTDDTLMPVEDSGSAYHTTGAEWKRFVRDAISSDIAAASAAAESAEENAGIATSAATTATAAKNAVLGMQVTSSVLAPGATPTLSRTESGGAVTLAFGLAPGAKGDQGIQGPQGPQGVQGPQGPVGGAASVEAATGLFTFSIGPVDGDPGHLLLTYAGSETAPERWYIDFSSDPDDPASTYGHLFYDPDA